MKHGLVFLQRRHQAGHREEQASARPLLGGHQRLFRRHGRQPQQSVRELGPPPVHVRLVLLRREGHLPVQERDQQHRRLHLQCAVRQATEGHQHSGAVEDHRERGIRRNGGELHPDSQDRRMQVRSDMLNTFAATDEIYPRLFTVR
ncbi:hypothetical protein AVEN_223624-1 [Araneus ventricosus]|uniref:Uncharacterized protein n=1 Tax=Araneus ventricosus TaxID=182803 RepID=A0A4Y2UUZ3_ARAVE|nr:hypothetical protein AVEN_223624-1 [Araneus ventricosus]